MNTSGPAYLALPEHLRFPMLQYLEQRKLPGPFLAAILRNDLTSAVEAAGGTETIAFAHLLKWIHRNAPVNAYGSPEKVAEWTNPLIGVDMAQRPLYVYIVDPQHNNNIGPTAVVVAANEQDAQKLLKNATRQRAFPPLENPKLIPISPWSPKVHIIKHEGE